MRVVTDLKTNKDLIVRFIYNSSSFKFSFNGFFYMADWQSDRVTD